MMTFLRLQPNTLTRSPWRKLTRTTLKTGACLLILSAIVCQGAEHSVAQVPHLEPLFPLPAQSSTYQSSPTTAPLSQKIIPPAPDITVNTPSTPSAPSTHSAPAAYPTYNPASATPAKPLTITPTAQAPLTSQVSQSECLPIHHTERGRQFDWKQYTLGAQDKIQIEILGFEKLGESDIIIPPNGTLILDLIGPIQASNITLENFHKNLIEAYSEYLVNPKISVNLIKTKAFLVYINGAVRNPGSYEISTSDENRFGLQSVVPGISINRTSPLLSNMLVAAGGILYDADVEHVHITNEETQQCLEVNLLSLLQQQDNMQDVHLIPGDTIVIPKLDSPILVDENKYKLYASSTFSPSTIPVKVVGYVNSPGLINLEPAQSRNLMSAIASAGGYLRESAYFPKEVLVLRHSDQDGQLHRFKVNPKKNDMPLFPNDIVYVPIKEIPRAGLFFDYLARIISPFSLFGNGYQNVTGNNVFRNGNR